jgi:putative membrane protein
MFIDYLTIMLVNLVVGFVLLAYYLFQGIGDPYQQRWVPGFAAVGIIGVATGLHMVFTWPLVSSFNIAFGEMELLFGVLFLIAALALAYDWSLVSVAIYAFFAGIAAIIVGARIIDRGMTQEPVLSGAGFILSGITAIALLPVLYWVTSKPFRVAVAIIALAAAAIWAFTGYGAYWTHLESFAAWNPAPLRQ